MAWGKKGGFGGGIGGFKMPKIGGGMRMPKLGGASGIGSLGAKHTMPHLMKHFQAGGANLASMATTPTTNRLAADEQFRQFLQAGSQANFSPSGFLRFSGPTFAQEGGPIDEEGAQEDPGELESPSSQMSPEEGQHREIVQNALAALDGASPDPTKAIQEFIQTFGERALADLQALHQQQAEQDQGAGEEASGAPESDQDEMQELNSMMGGAGGGLLKGRGTGQSDEIEGETPSGRPVLLSDGEYVIDAPTVSALGDGSTEAGARRLDDLRKQIRSDAWGHNRQAKPMSTGGKARVFHIK